MKQFAAKTALVTGAGSGIGAATAIKLAAEGARVIVADISPDKGERVVAQIEAQGGSASFQQVDLADEQSIAQCGHDVTDKLVALHVLVNNAGVCHPMTIEGTGHGDWDLQVAINLRAPALMAQALLPLLKQEGGAIVTVSSEGGFRSRPNQWVYDATKAGIWSLTRTMAAEFHPYGIRANTVAPGWTVTEMHFGDAPDPLARKLELEEMAGTAGIMGRLGRPEEIANAIVFLASDEASFITAATLHVDGGWIHH